MQLGIEGKRALVFASSQGLGKAIARELANEGVKVAISSRNESLLKQTANEINATSYHTFDLGQSGEASRLIQEVNKTLGGIDILVTNCGGPPKGEFLDLKISDWESGYQSVFLSVVEAFNATLPNMIEQHWGRVLTLTSVAGKEPIEKLTISNALRAGLHGLVNTVSKEVAEHNVTINALLPTFTETERLAELGVTNEDLIRKVPAKRLGDPVELGKLATFLCSDHSGFITGQAVAYDGGALQSV